MGVAQDELLAYLIAYVIEVERIGFLLDPAMKDHLQQNVAEFLPEQGSIFEVNSFYSLAGLLNEIASDRFVGLFSVPGTAALASEKSYDVEKIAYLVVIFLLIFDHGLGTPLIIT